MKQTLLYAPNSNSVYLGADNSVFAVYNISQDVLTNLSDKDEGNWLTSINDLEYDTLRGLVYIAGNRFGYFNETKYFHIYGCRKSS